MTSDLYFIINVFNVIIISTDNFICALLYATEWVYRLLSLNPEYNHNHNHNHNHKHILQLHSMQMIITFAGA